MPQRSPNTLAELKAMKPGADRVKAINAYVDRVQDAVKEAQALRNDDIRGLYAEHGWDANAKVAELTGMPYGTVRSIRGPASNAPKGKKS